MNRAIIAAAVLVAALILCLQLFVPPVVGLADNRDYERVIGYAGFQHTTDVPAERYFSFLRTKYAVVAPGWFRGGYHSSETLLAFVARYAHLVFAKHGLFDLRELAVIHVLLLLLALAVLIRACRDLAWPAQLTVAALLVFVFTDVGYAAPLNSFYSQAASLLFLLLTAAAAAEGVRRGRLSGAWLIAYFGCALLFVGSKPQEKLAAPLLALFGMFLAGVRWAGAWRHTATWLALALCVFSIWYGKHTPYTLREVAIYQVVFDEVLGHSSDPKADARELGLDPEWVKYTSSSPFGTDSPLLDPQFRMQLLHQAGYRKFFQFYLRHPSRLVDRFERASTQAWSLRPTLGNFEKSPEHPVSTLATRFSAWSRLRGRLGAHPIPWIAILLGGNLVAALATYRRATQRERLFRSGVVLMVLMSGLALAVCTLAQAPIDLSRALYAYHALCDLLLIADAGWIAETLTSSRKSGVPAAIRTRDR